MSATATKHRVERNDLDHRVPPQSFFIHFFRLVSTTGLLSGTGPMTLEYQGTNESTVIGEGQGIKIKHKNNT